MGKTKKRPYTGAKRWVKGCRNHGSCSWCERGRQHSTAKRIAAVDAAIRALPEEMTDYIEEARRTLRGEVEG